MGVHSISNAYDISLLLLPFLRSIIYLLYFVVSKNEKLLLFIYKLFVLLVCKLGYCFLSVWLLDLYIFVAFTYVID